MARRKDQERRKRTREAVQAYREKKREAGLIEVRGIWAPIDAQGQLKVDAKILLQVYGDADLYPALKLALNKLNEMLKRKEEGGL